MDRSDNETDCSLFDAIPKMNISLELHYIRVTINSTFGAHLLLGRYREDAVKHAQACF